ncbi:2-dehydropantoate 2-reductase [Aliiglaciecola sp. LCG003]|uniref:ketopantoate reductase family protein n=1 Tax=Aliiglaciecola sp. LCG003 TaxID=3053655 RepID=UPI00257389FB|nr:2-dehydropantoate 2-reductase [Aliiglaciecola sp. LCG003]WJG08321.1 2-dehydropantoate 2-reductase [Aliiglaciecola sp. LCG003]
MISIVGNGAIGNLIALACERQHCTYQMVTRSAQPIQIHCQENQQRHTLQPDYLQASEMINSGIVILPLKAYQILPAIEQLKGRLATKIPVILLHNGLGTYEYVLELLPENPIMIATTSYAAFKPDQGALMVTGKGQTQAGWVRDSANNPHFQTQFEKLLPPCSWHTDIQQVLWNKLLINAVINPLTTLNNIRNGQLAEPQYTQHIEGIVHEVVQVMQALGLTANHQQRLQHCYQVIQHTAQNYSSMHQDLLHKRPSEIDFINGYVVQQARRLDIPVPYNQTLLQQVKKMEAN